MIRIKAAGRMKSVPVRHALVEMKKEDVQQVRELLEGGRIPEAVNAFIQAFQAAEVGFSIPCGPGSVRGILPVHRGTGAEDLCGTEYLVVDPGVPGNQVEGRLEFHPGLVVGTEFRPEFRLLILTLQGGGELRFRGRELVRVS
ncbi:MULTISPECIES: hypothetical protein [Kyrpidia]|uniref:hypothetical protein n=1 Tax=Kyrpidia TaxID=1129704 RepID=UPI0014756392|nr:MULTISPECIES: hypothetical protein [Kyrpidia]MCL6574874.1 hypothetical protein [Kyrpidia sp.]